MNWIKKHKVLSIVLGLILLGSIGSAAGGGKDATTTQQGSNQASATPKPTAKPKLDIAAFYGKVQNGMTKGDVIALADKNPGNCTESETQGFGKYEICNWYGSFGDSGFATVTFKDDKVDTKSKTGF